MSEVKPKIEIGEELYNRIKAFKEVVEAVMDERYETDDFVAGLLGNGIDLLLERLLGNVQPEILVRSMQQLGAKYPAEVYGHIAETLRRGGEINKEEAKRVMGFRIDG